MPWLPWLLWEHSSCEGKHGGYERHNFSKILYPKLLMFFFSTGALIMKVQANKKCVSMKTTIKMYFPLLWQLHFYLRMKQKQ